MTKKEKESFLKRLEKGLYDYYVSPYRRSFARAQRDEDDLFMMLVFAESMGLPNEIVKKGIVAVLVDKYQTTQEPPKGMFVLIFFF